MDIKVITLNMWDGGRLLEEAIAFIQQENPDILALQEVYDGKEPELADRFRTWDILTQRLSYFYYRYAPEFIENRPEGRFPQGNAVFSKYPIKDASTIFFDRPLDENYVETPETVGTISRNMQHITLDTPAGDIHLFNFHGVRDLDGDNFSSARKNMSKVIIREVKGKKRVIVVGDTNAKPTNQAMINVEAELQSVFGNSLITTFNMPRKTNPGYATAVVDMIFVSDDVQVLDKAAFDVDVSDHKPLTATLRI